MGAYFLKFVISTNALDSFVLNLSIYICPSSIAVPVGSTVLAKGCFVLDFETHHALHMVGYANRMKQENSGRETNLETRLIQGFLRLKPLNSFKRGRNSRQHCPTKVNYVAFLNLDHFFNVWLLCPCSKKKDTTDLKQTVYV